MFGEKEAKQLDVIPVSNISVSCCIDLMSEDILAMLASRVTKVSLDVANLANLLVYVHYLFEDTVQEYFLFCQPLAIQTAREDIQFSWYVYEDQWDWLDTLRGHL